MYIEGTNFTKNYLEQVLSFFESVKQRPITDTEKTNLVNILKDRLSNQEYEKISLYNSSDDTIQNGNIKSLLELTYKPDSIISMFGGIFDAKKEHLNYPVKMLSRLKSKRKEAKTEMFKHINDVDKKVYNNYKSLQELIKVIMNSFYGALGQKSFILYNDLIPPSITYGGVASTTTILMQLESFIADNIGFMDIDDFYDYCTNCYIEFKNSKYNINEVLDVVLSKEDALKYLVDYFYNKFDVIDESIKESIKIHLSNFSEEYLNRFIYKRNFIKFISNEYVVELLGKCFHKDFLDPNEPPKEIEEYCKELYELIKEFVGYYSLYNNRYDRVLELERKAILYAHTDSVFLYIDPLVEKYKSFFELENIESENGEDIANMIICNIFTYINSRYIKDILYIFCTNLNIPVHNRYELVMKSEMLLSRFVKVDGRTNWAGWNVLKEGRIIKNEDTKFLLSGLGIKKVSLAKSTREFYAKLMKDEIFKPKEIKLGQILDKLDDFKATIRKEILEDKSLKYAASKKYTSFDNYKNPYSMEVVRGKILWNLLNEEQEILDNEDVNSLKLKCPTIEIFNSLFNKEKYSEEYNIIVDNIFNNSDLVKYGIKTIAIPKDVKFIPDYILNLVDIDSIIDDNIAPILPIMNSLGMYVLSKGVNKKQMTRYLKI